MLNIHRICENSKVKIAHEVKHEYNFRLLALILYYN